MIGLVISEFEPNELADRRKFIQRNKTVSRLSMGTLIVEAAKNSGTGQTARFTMQQNKNVFCIPGSLDNEKSYGTNKLIKQGAKLVIDVNDIISCYEQINEKVHHIPCQEERCDNKVDDEVNMREIVADEIKKKIKLKIERKEGIDFVIPEEYKNMYNLILEKPIEINEISYKLNIKISEALSMITMMELSGIIFKDEKGYFFSKLSTGKYRKVPQSTGKYRKVPQSTGKYRKVPESTAKYRKVPQSTGKYRKVPQSTGKYRKVPESTAKIPEIYQVYKKKIYYMVMKILFSYGNILKKMEKFQKNIF